MNSHAAHAKTQRPQRLWLPLAIVGAVCALVIGIYATAAGPGPLESFTRNPADTYYNLLVRGFRAGQLGLNKEVPAGLAGLVDPYDPAANSRYWFAPHWMLDLSYYQGRLYLYFGVTPALILFWPMAALTGWYLFDSQAVLIFCGIGFLVSVGVLVALWRRYFAEVRVGVVAACALALGLASGMPVLLSRSDVYEVSVSCGYMLVMLALGAIWRALHDPEKRTRWLTAASAAYGLALGARPSLLLGGVILLVPVIQAQCEGRRCWPLLTAAVVPVGLAGLGLMLYNGLRFDHPFEFGDHYQLAGERQVTQKFFSLDFFWFNFQVYFLKLASWGGRFPFVREISVTPLPAGYGRVEHPIGILTGIPLVWLALAVPLAWRNRSGQTRTILQWFVAAVALLFGACALTLGFFRAANIRYEVEFLPALVFLATIGILSLERAVAPTSESGQAKRPVWRPVLRWGWCLLLGFSVAFNLLASVGRRADAASDLGVVFERAGRMNEAIKQYERALELDPDFARAHNYLGNALVQVGRLPDAIEHYEQAVRIRPDFVHARNNLGNALAQAGRLPEAIAQFDQALRIKPDSADAHNNLAGVLVGLGRTAEAVDHYEQAIRFKPDFAEAYNNLGVALIGLGKVREAAANYEQAVRFKPDFAEAHYNLGVALIGLGRPGDAAGHFEQALRINREYVEAHTGLGLAFEQLGRMREAKQQYEQALRLRPDYAEAQQRLGRLQTVR
jgi:tetratricopeptide (TPR) repeat protein